ncbi:MULTISPECIES: hypothetical protein [unclassified Streptomyces]|uniref:hypothetical protein n=1 Tax=unclassified Streptomyces TaxID=2593676 RepID=UPI00037B98BF|nr:MULTISPECIES: hypothetical protein [unclassified Streptomyces]MYX38946.1 hypothetical protein [Streptomyces sp. SID8377]
MTTASSDATSAHRTGVRVPAARAAVFATVSVVLAVTGHHLVSGDAIAWRAAGIAGIVLWSLLLPVIRKPRSLPVTMVATVSAQGALHSWLGVGPVLSAEVERHHHHPADRGLAALGNHDAWHAGHHNGWLMAAAHLTAALVVACGLHRADQACRAAATTGRMLRAAVAVVITRLLGTAFRPHTRTPGSRPLLPFFHLLPRGPAVLAHAVVRRGPPAAELDLAA